MNTATHNEPTQTPRGPTFKALIRLLRFMMSLAMVELILWQWIAYPIFIAALIVAIPLIGFIFLFWYAPKSPLIVARLCIIWISLLLVYSMMEVLSHPIVRALAVTQGVIDVLLYFVALGVVRSTLAQATPSESTIGVAH